MTIETTPHADLTAVDLHLPGYSQAGDPGAVGAGRVWHKTSDDTFWVRNAANSGWVEVTGGGGAIDYAEAGDLAGVAFGDTANAGTSDEVPRADHRHAAPANPVTAHEAAGDPHTGYRLESADHSHASSGAQGGTVAHGALTGIAATDHHAAPTAGPDADVTVDAAGAAGTAGAFARAGHGHKVATQSTAPSTQAFGDAAAAGTSGQAPSRGDHKHAMPANPVTAHESGFNHTAHASRHNAGGADAMAIDAAAATGSLRTLGTGAAQAAAGDHAHAAALGQLFLSAAGMLPSVTAGCAPQALIELATNKQALYVLDFDGTTEEYAQALVAMPADWNGGTVTAIFWWAVNASVATAVVWSCQGYSYGDNEALDAAWGAFVDVTDTAQSGAHEAYKSAATAAITIGGTPAAGELVLFRVRRKPTDAADTMTQDARLIGVMIGYTRA